MDIKRFIAGIPDQFYAWGAMNGYPRDPLRYIEVLDDVQGMTTPSTMHLLNFACQCMEGDEVYLEVGTWRGATFIGALLGNNVRGYAVDNDTLDKEHNKDERPSHEVWVENVTRYGGGGRSFYIQGSVPDVWRYTGLTGGHPVGVYLFDGDKATVEAAYAGLAGVPPFLAKRALILIDDANTTQIRQASYAFRHEHPEALLLLDFATPANCWPSFWNGLQIIAWGVDLKGIG